MKRGKAYEQNQALVEAIIKIAYLLFLTLFSIFFLLIKS
jgi:hypothetical protein